MAPRRRRFGKSWIVAVNSLNLLELGALRKQIRNFVIGINPSSRIQDPGAWLQAQDPEARIQDPGCRIHTLRQYMLYVILALRIFTLHANMRIMHEVRIQCAGFTTKRTTNPKKYEEPCLVAFTNSGWRLKTQLRCQNRRQMIRIPSSMERRQNQLVSVTEETLEATKMSSQPIENPNK